jgi:hypothetical protein
MKSIWVGLGVAATFFGLASSQSRGQGAVSSGLLLGLRDGEQHSTIWVAPQNGKLLARRGQDVLLPRQSGWWRVGAATVKQKTSGNEQTTIRSLWASTIGNKGTGRSSFEADCQEDSFDTLLFVHEAYLALENSSNGYCKGAAHPWAVSTLEVRNLDVLERAGNSDNISNPEPNLVEIGTALGANAAKQFTTTGEGFYKKLPTDKQEVFEKSPQATNWALIRRNGQWVLRGRLGYAFEAARSVCCIDFDAGLNPQSLVGHDKLAVSWASLKAKYPKIIDAFSSPKNDLLFTLEPQKLTAFALSGGKLGGVLLTVPFKNRVTPVMIEWATGASTARWSKDLSAFVK